METTSRLNCGAGVFLKNTGSFLLMKRAANRPLAANVWSCIGGHMEPNELNDPLETCLRELYEESGIKPEHVSHLELRYLMIRRAKASIRVNYLYFGETDSRDFVDKTEEGLLHWVKETELLARDYTQTYRNDETLCRT